MDYPKSFDSALNHAMLYEVGGHWRLSTPGVKEGLIGTPQQRRAVGYVNDPTDMGGETKFGVAKNGNPDLNIRTLDWAGASSVYYKRYWLAASCDKLTEFAPRVAVLHFDGAVNHGVIRANRFLQRALGVKEDGVIGNQTLGVAKLANQISLCHTICDIREKFYRDIVANKPAQVRFLNGWLRRINEMRAYSTATTHDFA